MNSALNIIFQKKGETEDVPQTFKSYFRDQPYHTLMGGKVLITEGTKSSYIRQSELHIFIYGEIYEGLDVLRSISSTDLIKDRIDNTLSKLNGSFIIVIIDESLRKLSIITDRINSKRLFFKITDEFYVFTTFPGYFNNIDNEINPSAVACYLVNGVVYNNNTLFRNISSLDRAAFYLIDEATVAIHYYWEYIFTNEYAGVPREELKKKFAKILETSVSLRIYAMKPRKCFISLSGGYDSRFILGAVRSHKDKTTFETFSYGMDNEMEFGDDTISQELAARFKFKHKSVSAYGNDIQKAITENAHYGFGLANFCDEINVWSKLSKDFIQQKDSLLFVGDMFCHSSGNTKRVKDKRLPLQVVKVNHFKSISPFIKNLPVENKQLLRNGYNKIYRNILKRLPDTEKFEVIKDYAYLDNRISHALMYWREFFHGPFIKVVFPLLDNEILDFYRKLPDQLRHNKMLYKEVVREMFPDLFEIPLAQNVWDYPSWLDEIQDKKEAIIKRIEVTDSLLDTIFPKSWVISLLNNLSSMPPSGPGLIIRAVKKLTRMHDLFNNIFGRILLKNFHIKNEQFVIRLLVLRESLER